MERKQVQYDYQLSKTLARLTDSGLLLAASKGSGESNVMTIGWATVGIIWGKPIFQVLVRPSRYTYEFIEDSGCFAVNVPTPEMLKWVAVCGSRSGRELDKFSAYDMTFSPGQTVDAPAIDGCPMLYECRVVHWNDLLPPNLAPEIEAKFYGGRDYHRIYFGEILGAFATKDY